MQGSLRFRPARGLEVSVCRHAFVGLRSEVEIDGQTQLQAVQALRVVGAGAGAGIAVSGELCRQIELAAGDGEDAVAVPERAGLLLGALHEPRDQRLLSQATRGESIAFRAGN